MNNFILSFISKSGAEIIDLLLSLHQNGRTLILVTHDAWIAKQARRKIALKGGRIVEDVQRGL